MEKSDYGGLQTSCLNVLEMSKAMNLTKIIQHRKPKLSIYNYKTFLNLKCSTYNPGSTILVKALACAVCLYPHHPPPKERQREEKYTEKVQVKNGSCPKWPHCVSSISHNVFF